MRELPSTGKHILSTLCIPQRSVLFPETFGFSDQGSLMQSIGNASLSEGGKKNNVSLMNTGIAHLPRL